MDGQQTLRGAPESLVIQATYVGWGWRLSIRTRGQLETWAEAEQAVLYGPLSTPELVDAIDAELALRFGL